MTNLLNVRIKLIWWTVITLLIVVSCTCTSENDFNKKNKDTLNTKSVKFFQIQLRGISTLRNSLFTYSSIDSSLFFHSIGQRSYLMKQNKETGLFEDIGEVLSPNPVYFKLCPKEYLRISVILDSFEEKDFKGGTNDMVDGEWLMFSFILNNNKIVIFENVNFYTANQKRLFDELIKLTIENNTDSLTNEYLLNI